MKHSAMMKKADEAAECPASNIFTFPKLSTLIESYVIIGIKKSWIVATQKPAEKRIMNRACRDIIRWRSNVAPLQSSRNLISASEIRNTFLDYFCQDNGHMHIRSSPVFSLKDPTLAFTNAGMNQFKKVFLGLTEPPSKRVANSQKCIRIGGTHNDLSQVGSNGMHHTFFEMLGNWSFGDYFKEESCRMSWDLLTKVFKIPPEKLYVTYFKGDETLGLGPDLEVKEIWQKIGVKDSHILSFGAEENFWTGSLTGPCGPCTEIHYDRSSGSVEPANLVNQGSSSVIELWNIVFTQYNRNVDGSLTNLNTHFVDTGMGFERLVAVLQGQFSNYDTDLFLPLFEIIKNHTGHSGYTGKYDGNEVDTGYRVLADHSRMIAVALSDGMLPNHEGKVKSIIKKAFSVTQKTFNAKLDLLKELTTCAAESLSDAYPEIEKALPKIHHILEKEEETLKTKTQNTLQNWKKITKLYPVLSDLDVNHKTEILLGWDYINENILKPKKKAFSNENIFYLYYTHGVPLDQMQQLASKLGLQFDAVAYKEFEDSEKKKFKEIGHDKLLTSFKEYSYLNVLNNLEEKKIQPTDDYFKYDYKVDGSGNYIFKEQPTTILAILLENNLVDEITAEHIQDDKEIGIVLDRTQLFSAEGGQDGDFGTLEIEKDIIFDIEKVVKVKNYVLHYGRFRNLSSNSKVSVENIGVLKLDESRRKKIMQHHTALHLLNAALREEFYLTSEKRSAVTPEKLSLTVMMYRKTMNLKGVKNLEKFVKDFILHGVTVNRKIYNLEEFQSLNDVVFIPGETILQREVPVIEINSGFKLTRDYCEGTHVLNTAHLQDFVITQCKKAFFFGYLIEAVAGEQCSEIRKTDSEFREKFSDLKKKISECYRFQRSEIEDIHEKLKDLSSEILESDKISYPTRKELNNLISEARKNLPNLSKKLLRNFLTDEIKKASAATSEKFIVHCIDCQWDFDPEDLESSASVCDDKPLLFLFRGENSVIIQCIVPQAFVNQEFSARKWLKNSVLTLSGTAICKKNQNPDLIYFTHELKCTETQLRQSVNFATEFAKSALVNAVSELPER